MLSATTDIRVRYAETDKMGVVYHANYFAWFEVARIGMLDQMGLPYAQLEERGYLLPVLECSAKFYSPGHFDDRIAVTVTVDQLPIVRIEAHYEVRRGEEILATGQTVHAFISPQGKILRPPEDFVTKAREIFEGQQMESRQP